mmetsp:Transcript_1/g.5  ORF Transcript_1/g.5 Transcript_1/m.5 type:complete len:211 (+) Transcript_1:47-679(+)
MGEGVHAAGREHAGAPPADRAEGGAGRVRNGPGPGGHQESGRQRGPRLAVHGQHRPRGPLSLGVQSPPQPLALRRRLHNISRGAGDGEVCCVRAAPLQPFFLALLLLLHLHHSRRVLPLPPARTRSRACAAVAGHEPRALVGGRHRPPLRRRPPPGPPHSPRHRPPPLCRPPPRMPSRRRGGGRDGVCWERGAGRGGAAGGTSAEAGGGG